MDFSGSANFGLDGIGPLEGINPAQNNIAAFSGQDLKR